MLATVLRKSRQLSSSFIFGGDIQWILLKHKKPKKSNQMRFLALEQIEGVIKKDCYKMWKKNVEKSEELASDFLVVPEFLC